MQNAMKGHVSYGNYQQPLLYLIHISFPDGGCGNFPSNLVVLCKGIEEISRSCLRYLYEDGIRVWRQLPEIDNTLS